MLNKMNNLRDVWNAVDSDYNRAMQEVNNNSSAKKQLNRRNRILDSESSDDDADSSNSSIVDGQINRQRPGKLTSEFFVDSAMRKNISEFDNIEVNKTEDEDEFNSDVDLNASPTKKYNPLLVSTTFQAEKDYHITGRVNCKKFGQKKSTLNSETNFIDDKDNAMWKNIFEFENFEANKTKDEDHFDNDVDLNTSQARDNSHPVTSLCVQSPEKGKLCSGKVNLMKYDEKRSILNFETNFVDEKKKGDEAQSLTAAKNGGMKSNNKPHLLSCGLLKFIVEYPDEEQITPVKSEVLVDLENPQFIKDGCNTMSVTDKIEKLTVNRKNDQFELENFPFIHANIKQRDKCIENSLEKSRNQQLLLDETKCLTTNCSLSNIHVEKILTSDYENDLLSNEKYSTTLKCAANSITEDCESDINSTNLSIENQGKLTLLKPKVMYDSDENDLIKHSKKMQENLCFPDIRDFTSNSSYEHCTILSDVPENEFSDTHQILGLPNEREKCAKIYSNKCNDLCDEQNIDSNTYQTDYDNDSFDLFRLKRQFFTDKKAIESERGSYDHLSIQKSIANTSHVRNVPKDICLQNEDFISTKAQHKPTSYQLQSFSSSSCSSCEHDCENLIDFSSAKFAQDPETREPEFFSSSSYSSDENAFENLIDFSNTEVQPEPQSLEPFTSSNCFSSKTDFEKLVDFWHAEVDPESRHRAVMSYLSSFLFTEKNDSETLIDLDYKKVQPSAKVKPSSSSRSGNAGFETIQYKDSFLNSFVQPKTISHKILKNDKIQNASSESENDDCKREVVCRRRPHKNRRKKQLKNCVGGNASEMTLTKKVEYQIIRKKSEGRVTNVPSSETSRVNHLGQFDWKVRQVDRKKCHPNRINSVTNETSDYKIISDSNCEKKRQISNVITWNNDMQLPNQYHDTIFLNRKENSLAPFVLNDSNRMRRTVVGLEPCLTGQNRMERKNNNSSAVAEKQNSNTFFSFVAGNANKFDVNRYKSKDVGAKSTMNSSNSQDAKKSYHIDAHISNNEETATLSEKRTVKAAEIKTDYFSHISRNNTLQKRLGIDAADVLQENYRETCVKDVGARCKEVVGFNDDIIRPNEKTVSTTEVCSGKLEVSISRANTKNDLLLSKDLFMQYGNNISAYILGNYSAIQDLLYAFKIWSAKRKITLQLLKTLLLNVFELKNKPNQYKEVAKKIRSSADLSTSRGSHVSFLAKIISIISSFVSRVFGSKSKSSDIGTNEEETALSLSQDMEMSAELYRYCLICDEQFENTRKLVDDFHQSITEGNYACLDGISGFIEDIAHYKTSNFMCNQRLRCAVETLMRKSDVSELNLAFTRIFRDNPDLLEIMDRLDWRFNVEGFHLQSIESRWQELNILFLNVDSSSFDQIFENVYICLIALSSEHDAVERNVSRFLQQ